MLWRNAIELNTGLLTRFVSEGENWTNVIDRTGSISSDAVETRHLIAGGALVPSGQILRGVGRNGAVLYSSGVLPAGRPDRVSSLARKVSAWTSLGIGVGVDLGKPGFDGCEDDLLRRQAAITAIAASQDALAETGVIRTATMVSVRFGSSGIAELAELLTRSKLYRHLNMSVLISDEQMEAAVASDCSKTEAAESFAKLAAVAWRTGNPGFVFTSRVSRDDCFAGILPVAPSACAEHYLLEHEVGNLASINLAAFCREPRIDWDALKRCVRVGVRFLNNVIEVSEFPSAESASLARRHRRIGLGVMGFASMLDGLGVEYASSEALDIAHAISSTLRETAFLESTALADRHGAFKGASEDSSLAPRSNSHVLTVAPTGAISALWNVSPSIEPIPAHRIRKGSIEVIYRRDSQARAQTAFVSAKQQLKVVAAWQANVDGGISKTVSLPSSCSVKGVQDTIVAAWRMGCKGLCVFRDQCREGAFEAL